MEQYRYVGSELNSNNYPNIFALGTAPYLFEQGIQPVDSYERVFLEPQIDELAPGQLELSYGVDMVRTPVQFKEYKYVYSNENGINVTIVGCYTDVMAVVNALRSCPPTKNALCPTGLESMGFAGRGQNAPLMGQALPVSSSQGSSPGTIKVGIDNKTFVSSGVLLIVVDRNNQNAQFVLFQDPASNKLQELGDDLSSSFPANNVILFNNAKEQALRRSLNLFNIETKPAGMVDVMLNNNEYHREFLYMFSYDDVNAINTAYRNNMSKYTGRPETNAIAFSPVNNIIPLLSTTGASVQGIDDVTLKIMREFYTQGILSQKLNVTPTRMTTVGQYTTFNL